MTRQASAFLALVLTIAIGSARADNVALSSSGAVAVADSEYANSSAGMAIDGKWLSPRDDIGSNRWHSSLTSPHPHWVWIRFRQPASISKVIVHRADILDYPVDLRGEYSPDGGRTFRTLFTVIGNRMNADQWSIEKEFPPVTTDNFRLVIGRSSYDVHPDYAQVSEIEVFGDFVQGTPPAVPRQADIPGPVLKPTSAEGVTIVRQGDQVEFRSKWLRLTASLKEPQITFLCWDNLGEGKLDANLLKPDGAWIAPISVFPEKPDETQVEHYGNVVRYTTGGTRWEIRVEEKDIRMAITTAADAPLVSKRPPGVTFAFACDRTPVAPIANPTKDSACPLPCLLHAPDYGSMLVTGEGSLIGESFRPQARWEASIVSSGKARRDGLYEIPRGARRSEFGFSVRSDTCPKLVNADERLRAMPRFWLNGFQYRPDVGILSNNIVSDNCSFCMYQYADLAAFTPTLPGGIRPIEVVRESLDRYFSGAHGYGVGWEDILLDTYPAYLISAWDVIRVTGDTKLLDRWIPHLERFGQGIETQDRNGNGLPESRKTGVSGDIHCPTSNWWDQVNFGHEDAYACALAYRGFRCLADLERLAKRQEEATRYDRDADRILKAYLPTFYNPRTGILAGWKDSEGKLHDYWFVFVNGIAIEYGLVSERWANRIVDRIQGKMKEVGFTRFELGLPGNLIPIPKNDYGIGALGSPRKDDGTDTFGVFENGGASACMAYHYLQALYRLGRKDEADRILWAMMETYSKGGFQNGVGKGGEWTRWDGTPSGYEGYLSDAYYAQLALLTGHLGPGVGAKHLQSGFPIKETSSANASPLLHCPIFEGGIRSRPGERQE